MCNSTILKYLLALIVTVTCAWILFSGNSDEDAVASTPPMTSVNLEPAESEEVVALANAALEEFMAACPNAEKHWADVSEAKMTYIRGAWATADYPGDVYGWQGYFSLRLTVTNNPGGTLQYQFGGGEQPGLLISKGESVNFCGYGENPEPRKDYFVAWPPFKLIEG